MSYAGFWPRLKAAVVDFAVFLPLTVLSFWALGESSSAVIVVNVVNTIAYFAYSIIGHARWGQTIGKRVVRIRVRTLEGQPIGWTRAWRRSSVDIALGAASLIAYGIVIARIPAADFEAFDWQAISERYDAIRPWWAQAVEYLYLTWLGSEIVSVLFNRRRRALHDFLAGTVVAREDAVTADAAAVVLPPLRGWRRAVRIGDRVLAILAFVLSAFLAVVALGAEVNGDTGIRNETIRLALYALVVAIIYETAGRSLRRGARWHWGPRVAAWVLTIAPIVALFTFRAR
ncbi:MAG TPA: RDD family protein [Gemmatimonadaceae bacterium]|nr:RDD family protein [Gemmatimonadaceae bacterium]